MLTDLHYPDTELINDMVHGFPLSGWMPTSEVFPHGVRQPTLTVEALLDSLESFNFKVKQQMDMRQDETLERDTWDETVKELDKGWIWLDPCQDWDGKCVARRFGIHQGGKTRVDRRLFSLRPQPDSWLTRTFWSCRRWIRCVQCCAGVLKRAMPGQHPPIVGRTFDLKSAYKQFGLRTEDRDLIRIATVDPSEGKADSLWTQCSSLRRGRISSRVPQRFLWPLGL